MATRMQQRRGTAAQWTSSDPVLEAGEIGFESDTNKFKIGDSTNIWSTLDYFIDGTSTANPQFGTSIVFEGSTSDGHETTLTVIDPSADRTITIPNASGTLAFLTDITGSIADLVDSAPGALNTLNELAAALADDAAFSTTITNSLAAKAPIESPTFTGTVGGITKAMVGLTNVNDTTDANKPVSTAAQAALDAKAPLASPTFTGTVSGITKAMISLENVDNTTDANKPVSTAAQSALDAKAPLASPTFTGNVGGITKAMVGLTNVDDTTDAGKPVSTAAQSALDAKAPINAPTFTGNVQGITKAHVGLSSADDTSDTNKPVSTAGQTALDLKANLAGPTFTGTVSGITKSMVGLGNVDNTTDANKPVSTAGQTALDDKAPLASPALTGTPTAPTASAATNNTQVATTAYADTAVANLVDSAPGTLNTLNELAAALADDAAFSTTVTNSIALKAPIDAPTFTGTVTVAAAGVVFTDGTQTKQGLPSQTEISVKTASYTLSALTERDTLIEMNSTSATDLTIPTNAAIEYPIGTSIDILQINTGQVTIVGDSGVTVNSTPGLKLRARWSSCTLFKRATNTWIVSGDMSA